MDRREIAEALGTSLANLKRAFRGTRLAFYNYCTVNPGLVRQVNKYYETHTLDETAKAFELKPKQVDHIVNRYKQHAPKQLRWTDQQIIEATRMAGLVSLKNQAKYFNRPRANVGSIKSLWAKRFESRAAAVNGMAHWQAKHLVIVKARYLQARPRAHRVILWVDMEKCLKSEVPKFIEDAIRIMADFQRWLWKSNNPKPLILKMIKERELA